MVNKLLLLLLFANLGQQQQQQQQLFCYNPANVCWRGTVNFSAANRPGPAGV
jgi:hypothetical protein